jgi:cell division protein FtsW (lipid II flippase)
MTRAYKALTILLRLLGVSTLFALIAVFMPVSWMTATHRWLGLGDMPTAPVVEYLARSLSAFYALFGALCLVVASDLERYRPLIRFLGVAFAVMSVVFIGVDLAAGMPWWWAVYEGAVGIVLGALMFFLARPTQKNRQ